MYSFTHISIIILDDGQVVLAAYQEGDYKDDVPRI